MGLGTTGYLQWCKLHIFIWYKLQAPIVPTKSNLSNEKPIFEKYRRLIIFTTNDQTRRQTQRKISF